MKGRAASQVMGQGKGLGRGPPAGQSPGSRGCGGTTQPRPDLTSPRPSIRALRRSCPQPIPARQARCSLGARPEAGRRPRRGEHGGANVSGWAAAPVKATGHRVADVQPGPELRHDKEVCEQIPRQRSGRRGWSAGPG